MGVCHKVIIELSGVQFWSEIICVISNRTRARRTFDFEMLGMICCCCCCFVLSI